MKNEKVLQAMNRRVFHDAIFGLFKSLSKLDLIREDGPLREIGNLRGTIQLAYMDYVTRENP